MTTNQRLRQLKDEHGLTIDQIREMTSAGRSIVYAWLADDRNMPAAKLELLEMKLEKTNMQREQVIQQASRIAFEQDSTQIVGLLKGEWVIRDREDPESDQLKDAIEVAGYGEVNQ